MTKKYHFSFCNTCIFLGRADFFRSVVGGETFNILVKASLKEFNLLQSFFNIFRSNN